MRPEIIPNLLNFTVATWKILLYLGSVGMGFYTAITTYLREGKTEKARSNAIWTGVAWGVGGVLATTFLRHPLLAHARRGETRRLCRPAAAHLRHGHRHRLHRGHLALGAGGPALRRLPG